MTRETPSVLGAERGVLVSVARLLETEAPRASRLHIAALGIPPFGL